MRCSKSLAFAMFWCTATFAQAPDIEGTGSGLSMYKSRVLASVLPFDASRRTETHLVMQRLGQLSLSPMFNQEVAEIETNTFPELPRLILIDNDNDTSADYFIYHTVDGPSDLYGSFYALEEGGPPAWVVFPVGPVIDDNKEFLFLFTHWVDSNSDGKLDLVILEDVDLNASGLPEAGTTAWLADDDFDGLVDTAMHCVQQACTEIVSQNGVFDLRLVFHQGDEGATKVGEPFTAAPMLDGLFQDLRGAVERK